ncbi:MULTISPECIES: hypothetical protein [Bacteria]|uniref:hypothetical protein n=1 Tax=Bacteria TaxID=2 RepID=UPI002E7B767B|nr:hypothetical protein [Cetobacterium somerae]WVJ03112.1 hypothetical protein VSU16_14405 [Cetobacterium somerae]
MISKSIIILIALVFIGISFNQKCYKCKYQALFGGIVYLMFLKAPVLGIIMTVSFLITQFYASKLPNNKKK